jgi:hypothetical protein
VTDSPPSIGKHDHNRDHVIMGGPPLRDARRLPGDWIRAPQRGLGKATGVSYFRHSAGGLPLRSERLLGEEATRHDQRKRYKKKARACGLCKPHKAGRSNRWSPRELQGLRQFEQALQRAGDWDSQ